MLVASKYALILGVVALILVIGVIVDLTAHGWDRYHFSCQHFISPYYVPCISAYLLFASVIPPMSC